ncbi:hypothetical protein CEXT_157671 [Caerostris extrusa]|uniref:Uncharacterized protein n=1 Tax=Caerostris extrusa TaxID=172846 RepID=A0AAV4QV82_CAEEX|nr:hypothetical protein CEXT_157671 [Caerostris extrusa]
MGKSRPGDNPRANPISALHSSEHNRISGIPGSFGTKRTSARYSGNRFANNIQIRCLSQYPNAARSK